MLSETKIDDSTLCGTDRLQQTVVVIPTLNAEHCWEELQQALTREHLHGDQVTIVDSSSSDRTRELAHRAGYRVLTISKSEFSHGGTRQMVADLLPSAEFLLYMTQDAIPCGDQPIARLLQAFEDPHVGGAFGRQLPRPDADPIERFGRIFGYTGRSERRTFDSRYTMGFRAATFSNSFAAYRRSALMDVGGFPKDTIVSEDVTVAARMLMAGWELAYQADATVIHSHQFTVAEESRRYFDIGVHHGRTSWLIEEFGGAGGEGLAFVRAQMQYLRQVQPSLIPLAILRTATKLASYQLGLHERFLPRALKAALSGQAAFWEAEQNTIHPADARHHGRSLERSVPASRQTK